MDCADSRCDVQSSLNRLCGRRTTDKIPIKMRDRSEVNRLKRRSKRRNEEFDCDSRSSRRSLVSRSQQPLSEEESVVDDLQQTSNDEDAVGPCCGTCPASVGYDGEPALSGPGAPTGEFNLFSSLWFAWSFCDTIDVRHFVIKDKGRLSLITRTTSYPLYSLSLFYYIIPCCSFLISFCTLCIR